MARWVKPGDEFAALFRDFQRSVWRWECQGTYREPSEREPMRLWQEGHPDPSYLEGWLAKVRGYRAAGKRFERVRMVTEPLTEYLRWQFTITPRNVEAGEDIRWIGQSDARQLELPDHDFYILDDEQVAIMRFGDNGVEGAEVTSDLNVLAEHRRWRDLAWAASTPHAAYLYDAASRSP